jgi:hypothetical protein
MAGAFPDEVEFVMAGLGPAIHLVTRADVDARVKPAHDGQSGSTSSENARDSCACSPALSLGRLRSKTRSAQFEACDASVPPSS